MTHLITDSDTPAITYCYTDEPVGSKLIASLGYNFLHRFSKTTPSRATKAAALHCLRLALTGVTFYHEVLP